VSRTHRLATIHINEHHRSTDDEGRNTIAYQ